MTDQPQFDGECAFAVSLGKSDVAGSAKHQVVADGSTYYFKNPVARFLWRILPNRSQKAEGAWAARAAG
jgi:hypothetical protein